jgi:DNA-directed RNA polymerase specialized sigma24 family protein
MAAHADRAIPADRAAALALLYRAHRPRLVRYAAGAVGAADAEDVVQAAFERLLRSRPRRDVDLGQVLKWVSWAASHHRRDTWAACRDARLAVRLDREHPDRWCLEDAVCTNVVLGAFLRALYPAERRGLFAVAFRPGEASHRDRTAASNARRRLRTLRDLHGL